MLGPSGEIVSENSIIIHSIRKQLDDILDDILIQTRQEEQDLFLRFLPRVNSLNALKNADGNRPCRTRTSRKLVNPGMQLMR